MSNGTNFLKRSPLITLGLIFLTLVILINAIPAGEKIGERGTPTDSFQNGNGTITASFAPTLASIISQTPASLVATTQSPTFDLPTQVASVSSSNACATAWGITPPTTIPDWLGTPSDAGDLQTEVKYYLLAGHLISSGSINASDCIDGGLTQNGAANTCGMEKAYPQVILWQNQFDQEIFAAAQENQIPAEVLKRLFAQETQFWPPDYYAPPAYGIGNVTSRGIEPLFIWYDDIYQNTCQEVYSQSCTQSYLALPIHDRQILRGFFISRYIDAYCDTCLNSIDLEKTKRSIDYFAKLIVANCYQVDQILQNHSFSTNTLSYEDAWRLTLANYTVGPTCLDNGLEQMDVSKGFSWDGFTDKLGPNCSTDIYLGAIMH